MPELYREQEKQDVFAMDIGTRSIIGVLGRLENGRLHVLAIEKENHEQRAMMDGQIEDIDRVASVAQKVVARLEARVKMQLHRVCVAAAGRALRSEQARFALALPAAGQISEDTISQLESGAVSEAERALTARPDVTGDRLYMVGYTVAQYLLDGYPMSTLKGHSGQQLEADVVATFLPQEVVESLYAVVAKLDLEVASLTLEPIASLNAAIPEDIRLLNLVLVDIGAGTSDIAVCRDGSVVGYTMATVAGDEITELLMRKLLVDFQTGELMKTRIGGDEPVPYTDILGIPHQLTQEELRALISPGLSILAKEIAGRVLELNGRVPSAVFLAGGGSKLAGLRECVAEELKIEPVRVAIAGRHFERSAFAEEYNLNDPEYATPLGIAISAAMGLINDSYIVLLNGKPAKLFRSGMLTIRDLLLMNGFRYSDLIGRTGANLSLMLNGERMFFRGAPATPPEILLNDVPAAAGDVVHAGDRVTFLPARSGEDAVRTVAQLVGENFVGQVMVNGAVVPLATVVQTGDDVWADPSDKERAPSSVPAGGEKGNAAEIPSSRPAASATLPPPPGLVQSGAAQSGSVPSGAAQPGTGLRVTMNGEPLHLPGKPNGEPYYLMDMLEYSGLDFDHLQKPVELLVNGEFGQFAQLLQNGDQVVIQ